MDPSDHDKQDLGNDPSGRLVPTHTNGGPPGIGWLRSVLENSDEVVKVLDPDGTLRYASPAFGRVFGYDPGDAVGRMNVLDHVHPDDLPRVLAETERALAEGRTVSNRAEYRFRHKDGSWRWVESVGTYLLDDPQVRGVVVNARDITERKRTEGFLREAEERYRTLVERVPAMTYVHHQVPGGFSGTTYVSPQVETILGYTPEEYTSDPEFWKSIVHPDDRERVLADDERTGGTGEPFDLDFRMVAKDGRAVWLRESGTLVSTEEDGNQVWHGIMLDITELKRVEGELRRAEERYRTLVEQIPAVTYIDRADGSFEALYTSPQIEDLLGYTPEEWIEGRLWEERLHPDDRERILAADERLEAHGEPFAEEYRLLAKDGSVVWVREGAVLVRDEGGEPLFWQGVIFDLTERRRTEEALRRSEALLAESQRIAGLGTWEWDVTSGEVWWSEETYRLHGLESEEAADLRERVEEAFFPEDLPLYKKKIEEALSGEAEGYDYEHRLRRADGEVRWVHGQAEVVRGEGGEPLKMVGTVHDITERKEAELALRDSEERYRVQSRELFLLHQVRSNLSRELDPESVCREVVEAIAETYGYTQVSAYLLEGEDLVLQHQVGYEQVIERIRVSEGVSGRTVRTGRSALVEDVRTDPDFLGAIEGIISEICVPLFDGDEAAGFVNVESRAGLRLTQKDLRVMEALAEHVNVALSRAKLHARLRGSEEHFRALTQNSSDIVTLLSATGTIRYQSPAIRRILGYRPEETVGDNAFDYVHPEDLVWVQEAFAEGLADPGRLPTVEYRFRHKDGRWVWLESVGNNLLDEPGVGEYVVNSRDISRRKEAEGALRESEGRFRSSFDDAAVGMALVGLDGRWLRVNRSLCEILGYPQEELLGKTFLDVTHPADLQKDLEHLRRLVAGEARTYQVEKRYLHKDGHVMWALLSVSLVHDEGGGPLYFVSQIQDIGERKRMEGQLLRQALHDDLTGLPNRKLFVDRLRQALEKTRRMRGSKVAVLFMDLDGFKVVNDSLGHEAGDLLLTLVAQRLRRVLRPEDTLARFGGDEFVVLVGDVDDPREAVRVADRITEELKRPFVLEGRGLFAPASIGIGLGDARTKTTDDLLRDADTAMYRAKQSGAGYEMFDPAMYERAVERLEMENDLRRAIEGDEFVVHYQPIVRLDDRSVRGLEALVRWRHPEKGFLNPDAFVPVAEESGLVVPMGEQVLWEACLGAKGWQEGRSDTSPLVVSVNLSARQLGRPELADIVERTLSEVGLEARRLSLDVTETVYVRALEGNTEALGRLRALGVGISIDDFGMGYSSLSYLKRLPADALKVDRSFVAGLGEDAEDTAIVGMIIGLAHTLGMEVVAEGVETEGQAEVLLEMGCDLAQGYHFSGPLPPEEVPGFLAG